MKAVILVGGLGTRLRPFTFSIPKPLLPLGDRTILQLIIEQLKRFDIDDIILATGYKAELIHAFCGDGSNFGVNISYVCENTPLGTAGPLSLVRDRFVENELFNLMNGDIVTKANFDSLIGFSDRSGCDLTLAYTKSVYTSPFGVLSIEDDRVSELVEKPRVEYSISAGIYVLRSTVLKLIPDDTFFTIPQLVRKLLCRGKGVGAYHIKEYWLGLENIDDIDEALKELNNVHTEDFVPSAT